MGENALAGMKVLDLSSQLVGPIMTKCLADYGATVVLVESSKHPSIVRVSPPYAGGKVNVDRCYAFLSVNSSKFSITLDRHSTAGRRVLERLVAWADVVVENLTSDRMSRLGLSYDDLTKINPRVIMLSTTGFGQTGPLANAPAWGWNLFAAAGFPYFLGWSESEPMPCPVAYTDYLSPWYGVVAIMGALVHREKTGMGQFIDLAQNEVNLHYLAPALIDAAVNGIDEVGVGNRSPHGAPHGVYRCQGDDKWCAVAVFDDEQWLALCVAIGDPQLADDPRFRSVPQRKANEEALDKRIEEWTASLTAEEAMERLQSAGVAAGRVSTAAEVLVDDPQMAYRGYIKELHHSAIGPSLHVSSPGILCKTPAVMEPAPCMGQHTEYVCREILGLSDEIFSTLLAEGAFE